MQNNINDMSCAVNKAPKKNNPYTTNNAVKILINKKKERSIDMK